MTRLFKLLERFMRWLPIDWNKTGRRMDVYDFVADRTIRLKRENTVR